MPVPSHPVTTALRVVGADLEVPLVTGERRRYANLDIAASAPALVEVRDAVDALLPWYSSVHRGTGYKSMVCTEAYEWARTAVRDFVGARADDTVVFTRNTTDSLNLLAAAVPRGALVVGFETEHHANLLPWRRHDVCCLPAPASPEDAVEALDAALTSRLAPGRPCLVAVTGASNVTGEIWPVGELVAVARRHGARVVLDAAQLAPHRPVDVDALGVDYLALSGHKLYAPYGAGALVGRPDWLSQGEPFLAGGGAVDFVTTDDVLWSSLPDRQEAGSPNVLGAVALGVACRTLQAADMDELAEHEAVLLADAERRLAAVPGVERYSLWGENHPRIGVVTFNLAGYEHSHLAAVLSAEHGIGVRHGCFCAHPFMLRLLGVGDACAEEIRGRLRERERVAIPGAVRASFGVGTTQDDVDRLVDAVSRIARHGPRWSYDAVDGGDRHVPRPETRSAPAFPFGPAALAFGPGPHKE
ncbi:MAG: aminotransferase class V-fold PLP-dependent enzyme [Actinobacteria bacterium]|nr:aminotransferase class V-fold PLP-dependent enzyme [Actinomycetota bacterium]